MCYFDHAASTRPWEEVLCLFQKEATENFANPSSLHQLGFLAEEKIKKAKKTLAQLLQCQAEELIFTSGATESINQALIAYAKGHQGGGNKLVLPAIEHKASLQSAKEAVACWKKGEIVFMPLLPSGHIDFEKLAFFLDKEVGLISLSSVNNNVGQVQDLETLVNLRNRLCPQAKIHVDFVQSFTKYPISLANSGIDMASFSGHKIKGLKGIGLLYVKKNLRLEAYVHGAGQQENRRSGTLNMPLIVSFAKAVELSEKVRKEAFAHALALKKLFLEALLQKNIDFVVHGLELSSDFSKEKMVEASLCTQKLSPFLLNLSFLGVKAETLVNALSEEGFYISTQSSCSSKNDLNYVLSVMGVEDALNVSSVRISFALDNTKEEVLALAEKIEKWVLRLKRK